MIWKIISNFISEVILGIYDFIWWITNVAIQWVICVNINFIAAKMLNSSVAKYSVRKKNKKLATLYVAASFPSNMCKIHFPWINCENVCQCNDHNISFGVTRNIGKDLKINSEIKFINCTKLNSVALFS